MKLVFNRLLAGLVLLSLTAFSTAHAESGYVGFNAAVLDTEVEDVGKFRTPALVVKGGWQFHDYLAIEGRVGVGVGDDTTASDTVEVDSLYGVYLRPGVNLGSETHLYGILGFTESEVTLSGSPTSGSDSDFSYGIGLEFGSAKVSGRGNGHIEYMSYYDEAGDTIEGFAIGLQFKF